MKVRQTNNRKRVLPFSKTRSLKQSVVRLNFRFKMRSVHVHVYVHHFLEENFSADPQIYIRDSMYRLDSRFQAPSFLSPYSARFNEYRE